MTSLKGGPFFSVLFSAILLLAGVSKSEEKILFRHKFEEGKGYYVKQVTEQKITRVVEGKEQVSEQTIGFGYNFDVTEIDFDGSAWVSCEYDWTKVYVKNAQIKISYDSSEKKLLVPPEAKGFKLILDESFYMNITPDGKVKKVNGLNTISSSIKNKIPPGQAQKDALNSLASVLNKEAMKNVFEEFMAIFPEKEVALGQHWEKTSSSGAKDNKIVHKKKWTLKSRKDGVSLIEFEDSFKSESLKMSRRQQSQARYEISGTSHGLIKVEESTGRIIRSEIVEDAVGEYKSILDGKRPAGAPPPVKISIVKIREMTRKEKPVLN